MPSPAGASQPDREQAAVRGSTSRHPRIRRAETADARRLAEINAVTWTTAYAGLVPAAHLRTMTPERLLERWASRLAESPTERVTLVAAIGEELAGYAVGGPYRVQEDADSNEQTGGWGELYALYTDPEQQGHGAGTALADATLHHLASRGFTVAALWVLRNNEQARRWYAARGWRDDGTTSVWNGSGEPLEEIRMVRPLDPVGSGPAAPLTAE